MPSLKDIKTRIDSVKTTRQVTSAMKMVSAAKLKKAQDDIVQIRPYAEKMNDIMFDLYNARESGEFIPLAEKREADRILIVMVTSNRGLCGAFNSSIVKEVNRIVRHEYSSHFKNGFIDVVAIGKQGEKLLKSSGIKCVKDFNEIYNNVHFNSVEKISEELISSFLEHKYDRVILVYNEFINAAVQNVSVSQFLPLEFPEIEHSYSSNYIYEPEQEEIINEMIPLSLKTMFFRTLLDSIASEHGARMTSMHKATDNATELIGDLELSYNKARQTAITNEILEIVGGAEALSK